RRLLQDFKQLHEAFIASRVAVHGAAQADRRRERLEAWLGWLKARAPLAQPMQIQRPEFEAQRPRLQETLLLMNPALPPNDTELDFVFESYGRHADWLQGHLLDLRRTLDGSANYTLSTDQALVVNLLRYSFPCDLGRGSFVRF